MAEALGPRRQALFRAWKRTAARERNGSNFDFTPSNRTQQAQEATTAFLADPTRSRFEKLWTREVIADAVMGGPALVVDNHDSVEAVADTVRDIQTATEYNPDWKGKIGNKTACWELYGRLHPTAAPILNITCASGLEDMGFTRPSSYDVAADQWAAFRSAYESVVGHATAGTEHEVPLHHEMSELLWYVARTDTETIRSELDVDLRQDALITGWRDETPLEHSIELNGHEKHIEGFIEAEKNGGFTADGPNDLWNGTHWEDWKDVYMEYLSESVWPAYDKTDLTGEEAVQLVEDLSETATLSKLVPPYLYGSQTGGQMWTEFRDRTEAQPEEAAETLSYLFDNDIDLTLRLDRFIHFYDLDRSPGVLMSLVTMLLLFAYPKQYAFYKHEMVSDFFDEYSDYNIEQGFDSTQYWKFNQVCKKQLLADLERGLTDKDPTMMDVYTLLYIWQEKHYSG